MEHITALLGSDFLGTPAGAWLAFAGIVIALLGFDLGVLNRGPREVGGRASLLLSAGYIGIGLAFGAGVWLLRGPQPGMEFLTGFVIEKTLAMDNVFVIAMIFTFLGIPREHQHRVLFWGILGVVVLRALVIGLGAALVTHYSWVLYLFGAFLVVTGIKMLRTLQQDFDLRDNSLLAWLRRHLRVTDTPQGGRFWVRLPADESPQAPRVLWVTPLFLALVLIEAVDIVFAVDSVPAVFAITQDPFIVYTSNIFAILGLRALYFALAAMVHRFRYLKVALAVVLVFVGLKIIASDLIGKVPALLSLSITVAILAGGVLYSLYRTDRDAKPANSSSSPT